MKDKDKTKEEPINELVELRQRITELEREKLEHTKEYKNLQFEFQKLLAKQIKFIGRWIKKKEVQLKK